MSEIDLSPGVPVETPFGAVNHVISLGSNCYPAWVLKTMGLRDHGMPFDWCVTSPAMIAHVLEDDFETFLDAAHHRPNPLAERDGPNKVCQHDYYRTAFGVPNVFSHHDLTQPDVRAMVVGRVARFRRVMAGPDVKLLVLLATWSLATEAVFDRLCARIDAISANAVLLVVNVRPSASRNVTALAFETEAAIGAHRLLAFHATSRVDGGRGFENPIDRLIFEALIRQYRYVPAIGPDPA